MGFVFQKCFHDADRQSFDFFVQNAWRILWTSPFYPSKRGDRGWANLSFLPKSGEKKIFGTQPKKTPSPGPIAETPRADMGDSVSCFRRYGCWTESVHYHSNLSMRGTFLPKSIHLPDKSRITGDPKREVRFEFECRHSKRLMISNFSINLFYQKIVQACKK